MNYYIKYVAFKNYLLRDFKPQPSLSPTFGSFAFDKNPITKIIYYVCIYGVFSPKKIRQISGHFSIIIRDK